MKFYEKVWIVFSVFSGLIICCALLRDSDMSWNYLILYLISSIVIGWLGRMEIL